MDCKLEAEEERMDPGMVGGVNAELQAPTCGGSSSTSTGHADPMHATIQAAKDGTMPPLDWRLVESCNRFAPATVHGTTADGDILYLIRLGGWNRHALVGSPCMHANAYHYAFSSVSHPLVKYAHRAHEPEGAVSRGHGGAGNRHAGERQLPLLPSSGPVSTSYPTAFLHSFCYC